MTGAETPASVADRPCTRLKNSMPQTRRAPRRNDEIVSDMSPNHIDRMRTSSAITCRQLAAA